MGFDAVKEKISLSDFKNVNPITFYEALKKAKEKNPFEAYVTLHTTKEYDICTARFLLFDNTAGIAVEKDGNIISVFSDQTHRGILRYLLAKAVEVGGKKLDCFGSVGLRTLYLLRGFIPVARTKFVREYAPDKWNYERDGEPDILFWIYDTNHASPLEDATAEIAWDGIKEFPSYEEAEQYRNKLIS